MCLRSFAGRQLEQYQSRQVDRSPSIRTQLDRETEENCSPLAGTPSPFRYLLHANASTFEAELSGRLYSFEILQFEFTTCRLSCGDRLMLQTSATPVPR